MKNIKASFNMLFSILQRKLESTFIVVFSKINVKDIFV